MFKVGGWLEQKKLGMRMMFEGVITPLLVQQAKETAYWKDRSGHARQGINGGIEGSLENFELYLGNSTDYGQYLEKVLEFMDQLDSLLFQ